MGSIGAPELLVLLIFGGAYFAPTIVAARRHHRQVVPITVINVFLGWTFVGWVVALVWSMTAPGEKPSGMTRATDGSSAPPRRGLRRAGD